MAEGRQASCYGALPNEVVPPAGRNTFELLHKIRHIGDGSKVPRAIESHLRGREQIRHRSCMEGRKISGNHIGPGRAMMNLYRAESLENASFGGIHFSA